MPNKLLLREVRMMHSRDWMKSSLEVETGRRSHRWWLALFDYGLRYSAERHSRLELNARLDWVTGIRAAFFPRALYRYRKDLPISRVEVELDLW